MPTLVLPKVIHQQPAGMLSHGLFPHGRVAPPIPDYKGHPGLILAKIFAKPPMPKGVSHLPDPPLPLQGFATRSKNGERLHNNSTSGLWSKQKKSAEKKTNKKQQLKLSPTKCSQSKQHPRDSYVLRHLQSECVDNVPNMFFSHSHLSHKQHFGFHSCPCHRLVGPKPTGMFSSYQWSSGPSRTKASHPFYSGFGHFLLTCWSSQNQPNRSASPKNRPGYWPLYHGFGFMHTTNFLLAAKPGWLANGANRNRQFH